MLRTQRRPNEAMNVEAMKGEAMNEQSYAVEGMTCAHCAGAVDREVRRIEGVSDVRVDVAAGIVTVSSASAVADADVVAAVDEAGYTVVSGR